MDLWSVFHRSAPFTPSFSIDTTYILIPSNTTWSDGHILMPLANTKTLDTSWDHIKIKVLVPLVKNKITRHPMHASTSFHHSSTILAYITQARLDTTWKNFTLVHMQASTCKMHIQMQQSCSWACSPYLCAQIFIDPFTKLIMFISLPLSLYFISPPYLIFVTYLSPFVNNFQQGCNG